MKCSECQHEPVCFSLLKLCERVVPGTCHQGRRKIERKEKNDKVPCQPTNDNNQEAKE